MSFDLLGDLNWLAVIVAAVIYFALGAAWYSPALLGKPWMRSVGWDPEQPPPPMTPLGYAGPLVAYLVVAIAVGMLAAASGSDSVGEGIVLGIVTGIGVVGAVLYPTALFDPQKTNRTTWFWVTAGYHFLGLLITSVLVSIWT